MEKTGSLKESEATLVPSALRTVESAGGSFDNVIVDSSGTNSGMGRKLSAFTVSLLVLSVVLNVLAFCPEFYQATWKSPRSFAISFGALQLAVG